MTYTWRLWCGFLLVLLVLLTALTWVTVTAMRLERAEAAANLRAAVEEKMGLALWRMDSALAPLLAQENTHPFYRSDASLRSVMMGDAADDGLPFVLLRFQYAADGEFDDARLAAGIHASRSRDAADPLAKRIPHEHLLAKLSTIADRSSTASQLARAKPMPASKNTANITTGPAVDARAATEFQQRSQSLMFNNAFVQQGQTEHPDDASAQMLAPVWMRGELLLARPTTHGGESFVEGCLLDWNTMQPWLLTLIADLLPHAQLQPLEHFDAAGEAGLLAALPVRLLPGPSDAHAVPPRSAVRQTLALAWLAVVMSAMVGAMLVVGVVRLSQRRAAFVSAVTHELRTPLTTFRMYSEMLANGMVQDPDMQREYLRTLQGQSLRLTHLVENVLAYARLERGRGPRPSTQLTLTELLRSLLPHLQQLATAAQMDLVVERSEALEAVVRVNRSAVEQILINLIDNACKYAGETADRTIHLSARCEARHVALRVRDHGPGMPPQRPWFQPFSKSAQQAAHSAPGVGLGLGLSRRLAEQMGGRLDVDRSTTDGAALVLRLPRTSEQEAIQHSPQLTAGDSHT